ncbi:hypothetical protein BKA81DRAFT_51508 [Phyllosticta paracitricarpa]
MILAPRHSQEAKDFHCPLHSPPLYPPSTSPSMLTHFALSPFLLAHPSAHLECTRTRYFRSSAVRQGIIFSHNSIARRPSRSLPLSVCTTNPQSNHPRSKRAWRIRAEAEKGGIQQAEMMQSDQEGLGAIQFSGTAAAAAAGTARTAVQGADEKRRCEKVPSFFYVFALLICDDESMDGWGN